MSAFVGPIHEKMYERILYQDEMSRALLAMAEEKGWANGLGERADAHAPAAAREPLADLIDPDNIHGWLSEAVTGCERRFARIAEELLDGHPERLGALEGVMGNLGRRYGLPVQPDAQRAFEAVHDILLDGMPCDFPFQVVESGAEGVIWRVANCPHAPFWRDKDTYYHLRGAWLQGALEESGIAHTRTGDTHALRKEG